MTRLQLFNSPYMLKIRKAIYHYAVLCYCSGVFWGGLYIWKFKVIYGIMIGLFFILLGLLIQFNQSRMAAILYSVASIVFLIVSIRINMMHLREIFYAIGLNDGYVYISLNLLSLYIMICYGYIKGTILFYDTWIKYRRSAFFEDMFYLPRLSWKSVFFDNEFIELEYGADEIRIYPEEWQKLGYRERTFFKKRYGAEYVCQQMNTIIRKYADYRLEHEYPGFDEADKQIFDTYYEYFNKFEKIWLYGLVPPEYRGQHPAILMLYPKVMNELKNRYIDVSIVLGNANDFKAYWYDNRTHTNTVFINLLTEGYREYKKLMSA